MGANNSSKTRVAPVFDALLGKDPTGERWLQPLLEMGSRARALQGTSDVGILAPGYQAYWGEHERALEPPPGLLKWLVKHAKKPAHDAALGTGATRTKRLLLIQGDSTTIQEALMLLGSRAKRRSVWWVLEGPSFPDAYLETDKLVLVIEGKRTEAGATTSTTWMAKRSQILRHMDAAFEFRGAKRVYGLMIVEGSGSDETVPDHWLNEVANQVEESMVADSLPHRTPEERRAITAGFLGATTWRRLCSSCGIPWPPDSPKGRPH